MRVALYARYSSDLQSAASIADQFAVLSAYVARVGGEVVAEFSDAAISGATLHRPGIQALLAFARVGRCDAVAAEAMDRLSRDQEGTAHILNRLTFYGVKLLTIADGEVGKLQAALRSTVAAMQLDDTAAKTRRGQRGRVMAGRSAGGVCYGYRVVLVPDGQARGGRTIDPGEAAIVRRVFELYAQGQSPKSIARGLNAEHIPGPRARAWSPSTINGHASRGTGLLNNELYVGRLVWNRLRYLKDPDTGKRLSRVNPGAELVAKDVPELRIIEDDAWQAVKARQAELRKVHRPERARRPKYLFSGLTVCGTCGGGYTLQHAERLSCFNAAVRGTCANRRTITRVELETRALTALQTKMLDPGAFRRFCDGFAARMYQMRREHLSGLAGVRHELATVERRILGLVEAIADGYRDETIRATLAGLEAKRAELRIRVQEPTLPRLLPELADRYRATVGELVAAFNAGALSAREKLRGYVRRIVIPPGHELLAIVGHVGALVGGNGGFPPPQPPLTPTTAIELPEELWIVAA